MIAVAKSYMPPAVCVVAALLITAGVPARVLVVPFLLAEAVAMVGYIRWARDQFRRYDEHHHPMRRHDDHA